MQNICLKEFFEIFGSNEYSTFKKYIEEFNLEAEMMIGVNATVIPSEESLQQCRENIKSILAGYPYEKELFSDFPKAQLAIIRERFMKRLDILIGDTNFAKSFVSSEWYYNLQAKTNCKLEQTAIVAGYFKSIEQLLFEVIKMASKDRRITITPMHKFKEEGEGRYIQLNAETENRVDAMMKSLLNCLRFSGNRMISPSIKVGFNIIDYIDKYRERCRNGYFHKDNIYDWEEIKMIRNKTYQVLFLILGSLNIPENRIGTLRNGYVQMEEKSLPCLSKKLFKNWLEMLFGINKLENHSVLIFDLQYGRNDGSHEVQMCVNDSFEDNGFGFNGESFASFVSEFYYTPLKWNSDSTIEEVDQELKNIVKEYLEEGDYAAELKKHAVIAAGRLGHYEALYMKDLNNMY